MFKQIIAPIQQKILDRNMCPACTRNLDKQKTREPLTMGTQLVLCQCNRAYVYNIEKKKYRRALNNEVKLVPRFNK